MEWTRNRPTEPGFYWARVASHFTVSEPCVVEVRRQGVGSQRLAARGWHLGGGLVVMGNIQREGLDLAVSDCVWFGPLLPPPTPPEVLRGDAKED